MLKKICIYIYTYIKMYMDIFLSKCFYYFILKKNPGEFKKLAGSQKLFQVKKYQTKKGWHKNPSTTSILSCIKIPNHQMWGKVRVPTIWQLQSSTSTGHQEGSNLPDESNHLRPEVLHTSAADAPHRHLGQVDWATPQCHQPQEIRASL